MRYLEKHLGTVAICHAHTQGEVARLKIVRKVWEKIVLWKDKHVL